MRCDFPKASSAIVSQPLLLSPSLILQRPSWPSSPVRQLLLLILCTKAKPLARLGDNQKQRAPLKLFLASFQSTPFHPGSQHHAHTHLPPSSYHGQRTSRCKAQVRTRTLPLHRRVRERTDLHAHSVHTSKSRPLTRTRAKETRGTHTAIRTEQAPSRCESRPSIGDPPSDSRRAVPGAAPTFAVSSCQLFRAEGQSKDQAPAAALPSFPGAAG